MNLNLKQILKFGILLPIISLAMVNSGYEKQKLPEEFSELAKEEIQLILDIFENVFDHQSLL
jgi:hypothetical protein